MRALVRSLPFLTALTLLLAACAAPAQPAPAPAKSAAPAAAAPAKPAEPAKPAAQPAAPAKTQAPAAAKPAEPAKPAAQAAKPAAPPKKLKIASIPLVNFMPAYLAKELGYFQQEGLDVEIIEMKSGNELSQALISGSVDFITTAIERTMLLQERGQVTKSLVGMLLRSNYAIVVQPTFQGKQGDIKALKGLKLGITGPGSGSDVTLRGVLRDNGLEPDKDVTIVAVGAGPSSVAAMKAKQIDGMITFEPNLAMAFDQGVAKMFLDLRDPAQGGKWAKVANSSIQVTEKWLKENPDTARAIVRAIHKANTTIRTDRATTLKAMQVIFQGMDAKLLEKICATECPAFNSDLNEEIHKAINDAFKGAGQLKGDVPYQTVVAVEFKDLWK
ncbi:MAG: ABC transporter substrate-binding protein [Chloroflexi bacterium]|nr:ABC transporter substrate-binding protein [Chloroflexota bacterium]